MNAVYLAAARSSAALMRSSLIRLLQSGAAFAETAEDLAHMKTLIVQIERVDVLQKALDTIPTSTPGRRETDA